MAGTSYVLDVTRVTLLDRCLRVAICMEVETRRVLGIGVSASASDALVTALGDAVFAGGVPATVMADHGREYAGVVRECTDLGVTVIYPSAFLPPEAPR